MRESLADSGRLFTHPQTSKEIASIGPIKRNLIKNHIALPGRQRLKTATALVWRLYCLTKDSSPCHCLLSSQAERAISSAAQKIIPAARNSPFRLCPRSRLSADVELRFEPNPSPCEPPLADFNPPGTGLRNSYGLIFSTRSEGSFRALPALHTGTPSKAAHRYDSAETEARRHIKLPKLFLSSLAT